MSTSKPHSSKIFHALEAWLNHDPELRSWRAKALQAELGAVEPEYRRCAVRCYRRIDFPKDPRENERFAQEIRENPTEMPLPLLDLLHTGRLEESVSSWTTDPQVAKNHNGGVQDGHVCVIFCHDPKPEEVWLNLSELILSPDFLSAVGEGNYPAIQQWMKEEREVILEVPYVSPEDVYSWGEKVSDVDQLKRVAAGEGCSPEFIADLENHLKTAKVMAGQDAWLPEQRAKQIARKYSLIAREYYQHPRNIK